MVEVLLVSFRWQLYRFDRLESVCPGRRKTAWLRSTPRLDVRSSSLGTS